MKRILVLAIAVGLAMVASAPAMTINVDFAPAINDFLAYPNITVDYVGTAAAPDTGTIWNHMVSNNGSPAAFSNTPGYFDFMDGPTTDSTIIDSFGNALPGLSVTINSGLGAFGSGDNSPTDGDGNAGLNYISVQAQGLMREYLIANGDKPGLVTVAGLTPGQEVRLFLYGEGDNASNERQTKFTANGVVGATAGFAGFPHDTLVEGKDYVVLYDVFANASGSIEIKYELNGGGEAPFNGFQLTTIPEPTSITLTALGVMALISRKRK